MFTPYTHPNTGKDDFYSSLIINSAETKTCFSVNGRFFYCTNSVLNSLGYTRSEFMELNAYNLLHSDDAPPFQQAVNNLLHNTGKAFNMQARILHKNGAYVWIEGSVTNLIHDSTINGLVFTYTDITNSKETIKRLESFSYKASHDLQLPLCAVKNLSQMLIEKHASGLNGDAQKLLKLIDGSVKQMMDTTNRLLEFSRMGSTAVHRQQLDLTTLAHEIKTEIENSGRYKQVEFKISNLGHAQGDLELIKVVFRNLFCNANKYSARASKPIIEVGIFEQAAIRIYYVKDNGVGFEMQYASRLFEAFSRLHSTDEFEGTGIGLAMAHTIIINHGGKIWAEASPNNGATFYFTLGN